MNKQAQKVTGFTAYLFHNTDRADAIGVLARLAAADPNWPTRGRKNGVVLAYVAKKHGPAMLGTVLQAWSEYQERLRHGEH